MTLHAIGSAELGIHAQGGGVYAPLNSFQTIVTFPPLSGTYTYSIDPRNGTGFDQYGWVTPIPRPNLMLVSFIFRFASDFDTNVSIAEIAQADSGVSLRSLVLTNTEQLLIADEQDDIVGSTAANYVRANTRQRILWLYDQRSTTNTRDMVWIYRPAETVGPATTIAFVDGGGGADTITDSNSGFDVFTAGMIITVSGSASNDGTYTIVSVVAGTITLATGVLTAESAGASVTVDHAAQWYTAIDVTGHGDGVTDAAVWLTFGSRAGKGALPTTVGSFFVADMALQDLERSPNAGPIASIVAKIKMPDGDGTDQDFDTGAPDFNDVDEIPGDDDATKDEADAVNEKNSYTIAAADGSDAVLAVQVVGLSQMTANTVTAQRPYIYDGTTRDIGVNSTPGFSAYAHLGPIAAGEDGTYNQINGVNLSESLFNTLEAGLEITTLGASTQVKLTQIGLEYAINGPRTLPSDFPILSPVRSPGVSLGSDNMGMI